jgi:hypothetical protein
MPTFWGGEHLFITLFYQGDVLGESDSTESQPSKPVCDLDIRASGILSQEKNRTLKTVV